MNPQSELEKAIKHGEIARDALVTGSDAYKCLDELTIASKRLKQIEDITGIGQEHLQFSLQLLTRAEQAKSRLKEVEKERDEAWQKNKDLKLELTEMHEQRRTFEQQLSQLCADLKQCAEALKDIGWQLECPSRNTTMSSYRRDGSVIISLDTREAVKVALSLPSVQEALKK